jgi:hypothetical protein
LLRRHSLVILLLPEGMTKQDGGAVIRKRGTGLQVQVYAGRDPLTGRKRWVSQQIPGQTKACNQLDLRSAHDRLHGLMSFSMSFHLAPLGRSGAYWLDDPSDLSCKDSTQHHAVDGPPAVL